MAVKSHHIHKFFPQLRAGILGFTLEFCYQLQHCIILMHNEITDSLISYLFSLISVEVIIIVLFHKILWIKWGHKCNTGLPCSSNGKQSACNAGDLGLIPGLGRSSGEGNGSPLQYSFLENPMDRGAWWVTVHGVSESQTQLSDSTRTTKLGRQEVASTGRGPGS